MYIGVDIGGTKCAVIKGYKTKTGEIKIIDRIEIRTEEKDKTIEKIIDGVASLMPASTIGISCGGPLDEARGVILSPPNLPGWDEVHIVSILKDKFAVPVALRNDANACALAEWKFGAGVGAKNMVFLTFGTGLGAGLIIDGKLYSGSSGMAGEVGHIRLCDDGPEGYGKFGSFEGFCSGGGIARMAMKIAREALVGGRVAFSCNTKEKINAITTQYIAELARSGDGDAILVFQKSAEMLGKGAAVLVDTINPDVIVIGSIYARCEELFFDRMMAELDREALKESLGACKIVPAKLGDSIGDFAALTVAMECEYADGYSEQLIKRYPRLSVCLSDIKAATEAIVSSYNSGGKILLVGNGGSAADCEHVAGELLKGFLMKREPTDAVLEGLFAELGEEASRLQSGIPAIPLPSITGAVSAFANDVDQSLAFAQLVFALGKRADVLVAFSTSGNSENVYKAIKCARALGITTVVLTGESGGEVSSVADICIRVPETETYKVQEYHLPIYHAICSDVERIIYGAKG